MKRIKMVEFRAEAKKRPADLFDYAFQNDSDPVVHDDLEATPENIEKAKAWLAGKRSSAVYRHGWAMNFYYITVYAIEYYTADDDGEFIEGSDYDSAEEVNNED